MDAKRKLRLARPRRPGAEDSDDDEPTPGARRVAGERQTGTSNNPVAPTSYDSFISSLPEAKPVSAMALVTATLVEEDGENGASAEMEKKMRAREEALLKQLAEKDAQLKEKEAELRRLETGSATSAETQSLNDLNKQRLLQRYEVRPGRLIASGTFNSVHAVKTIKLEELSYRWMSTEHATQRQQLIALSKNSRLSIKSLNPALDAKKQQLAYKRLVYEARIVSKCSQHPNIISMVGAASVDVPDHEFFYLVPRIDQTLYECITKSWSKRQRGKPKFLFNQVRAAVDIAAGLDFLHSKNIMMSDLKPENIGFTFDGDLKLYNLSKAQSLARKSNKNSRPYNTALLTKSVYHGTPPYAAPEIADRAPCNISIDTFAFAIVLWEIMSLRLCFGRESKTIQSFSAILDMEKRNNGFQHPEIDRDIPKALQDIIRRCWAVDPARRPCIKDAHEKLREFQDTLSMLL